ncbi:GntR family transcriptional regulator [Clostridium sp. LIBA-8841]|uniref:GntR family transcriptional regulator n=1 Tax=Clostridium sp. LIBA-8841 TaxID=2987530 RepID=UPI002AC4720A|nr:GntR family transcriptional regulator [Clostridium sp. LIBA-8841]MDZ5252274.1 GntR family transcriptional regulator [Clostridium sp. LIBA-8841]
MIVELDFESDVPIYIQLKNEIIKLLANKTLVNGDSLPSVRSFASQLGINLHTVNKTYSLLKDEGYIKLDRRTGAVVSIDFLSNEKFKENLKADMQNYINECIARNISKEEFIKIAESLF